MTNKKVVAIIQARMGSTRLPGKVLKEIEGKPMLWHIVNRVKSSHYISQVVVATSTDNSDNNIVDFCKKYNINLYRGSLNDVLERFYYASKIYSAKIIIRITADCPLIDPAIIDKAILKYRKGNFDYFAIATGAGVAKMKIKRYPDGLDCEIFSSKALDMAYQQAKTSDEREHVTMFMWKNPNIFKIGHLFSSKDYSKLRFTVDHTSDLKFVRWIYGKLYSIKPLFKLTDIINLIKLNPNILKINEHNIGKEGYEKLWEN